MKTQDVKKYYFVSYTVRVSDKLGSRREFYNGVIDAHPFDWQLEMHDLYRKGNPHGRGFEYKAAEEYVLLFFQEISYEEFDKGTKIEY